MQRLTNWANADTYVFDVRLLGRALNFSFAIIRLSDGFVNECLSTLEDGPKIPVEAAWALFQFLSIVSAKKTRLRLQVEQLSKLRAKLPYMLFEPFRPHG